MQRSFLPREECCEVLLTFVSTTKGKLLGFKEQPPIVTFNTRRAARNCDASANIKPSTVFSKLTSHCTAIETRSQRHSPSDELFIKIAAAAVTESSISLRTEVLVATNESQEQKVAADYSRTVNCFSLLDAYSRPKTGEMEEEISQYTTFSSVCENKLYTAFTVGDDLDKFRWTSLVIIYSALSFKGN
ncbi:unnamed protein product [Echinostoma caproni]|uniref:Uncharacterized protein n=1 Tax=Echinostoma caproni TaxID=27848 RepID=A0A183AWX6_9TREM|nr:unnamed protein product [Echinostoma caproni]